VETVYDWLTLAIFAGLVVLFLQRSTAEEPRDHLYQYAPPALGCAIANFLGNKDLHLFAIVTLVATLGYSWVVLKPLQR
jgi:hypothetical protein